MLTQRIHDQTQLCSAAYPDFALGLQATKPVFRALSQDCPGTQYLERRKSDDSNPKYDLSELSKRILAAKGTYILDVDIDQLERINDELGRGAGDVAIAETAARIAKNVPPDTAFFRIGADEFIVITERGKLQAAEDIAERILSHSDDPVAWNDTTFTFSVSIGIAKIPTDIHELSPALELVQEAMYRAKKKDGNLYKVL